MNKYVVLGILFVLFVFGIYLRRRSEDRMWKNAFKETRAKRQR